MKQYQQTQKKGFALLLALIVSSVVLAIGVSILDVSINQINLSANARESEFAFASAHAGVECMQYWRNEYADRFRSSLPYAIISCFGANSTGSKAVTSAVTGGIVDRYNYEFNWGGTVPRCTQVEMYIVNAQTGNVTFTHPWNTAVGTAGTGSMLCRQGTMCTVVTSSGFNRGCTELNTSIFSVERELTVEF